MSYCISTNEETFGGNLDSRDDAIREGVFEYGLEIGQRFWIGQPAERKASAYFDLECMIERLAEAAYEDVGESAEGWPDMSVEENEQLEKLIGDFLDEHAAPSFFAVGDIEKIEITQELIDKYGGAGK